MEEVFRRDIDLAIRGYQNIISKLSKESISQTQVKLIEAIGKLKRQARSNLPGISFTQLFNQLYPSIVAKNMVADIDYQIFIAHFNETIMNDLLSSFEIINETLSQRLKIAANKTGNEPTWRVKAIAHNYKVKAGMEQVLTRKEMKARGGKRLEQAFDSLNPKTKSKANPYKAPAKGELNAVIKLLGDAPTAQKAATNDLSKLD